MSKERGIPVVEDPESGEISREESLEPSRWWPPFLAFLVAGVIVLYMVLNWPALWKPWVELVSAWLG